MGMTGPKHCGGVILGIQVVLMPDPLVALEKVLGHLYFGEPQPVVAYLSRALTISSTSLATSKTRIHGIGSEVDLD